MTALLALHLVAGLGVVAFGRRLGRWTMLAAAVPPAATLTWLGVRMPGAIDGEIALERVQWIGSLGLGFDLRLDGFAALMVLLVSGIGLLVVAYSAHYFSSPDDGGERLMGVLTLFAGAMVGLVVADNLLVLYGFWELTSITSFLLIGNGHEQARARAAALQALLVTGLGGLAMLAGFVVLGQAAGTYRLSELLADPPSGGVVAAALVLVLLGALTKSAQYPFHGWLPAAMVAPTPVSTYLHSATMVKAGVYLVARLAPVFAATVGLWRPLVVTVGAVTMIAAGLRALRQTDLKLLLAMGTISQLGFMIAVLGWGSPAAAVAGSVLLLAHGAFKASAFMVVGILDRQTGGRDLRTMPRLDRSWALLTTVTVVTAASMAGVVLTFGFIAKEVAFDALDDAGGGGAIVALAAVVTGSVLTAAYSIRFALGATGRLARLDHVQQPAAPSPSPPSLSFVAPAAVLVAVTVMLGVWPGLADGLVGASAGSLLGQTEPVRLEVWHGFTTILALSLVALVGGVLVALLGRRVEPVLAVGRRVPSSDDGYRAALRGLNAFADRVTVVAQPGSLPIYLGVILVTAAAVPAALLLSGVWWPGWPPLVETTAHVPIAALLLGFGLAAAIVRRRFSAALFLGMVGYAMAGLFVVQGAPDLALTQVAIETLTTVLFVLVLRRLPDRFETTAGDPRRGLRRLVAVGVGAMVFCITLAVGAEDPATTVSDAMIDRSDAQADGRNVVNVILVDFRGFDTLGELTVLAAGAIGTVALARAGRRAPPGFRRQHDDGPAERLPPPLQVARVATLDVSVRIVFAAVIAGSLWLLFAGHNQPGGGFVGGIVAGAAVALRYVAGGIADVRQLSRGQPWMVLGAGLAIAVAAAVAPLLLGGAVLESASWTFEPPVLGTVKLTSPLLFDVGVYLAVVGLALMVFESFGDDPAPPPRVARRRPPTPLGRAGE